MKFSCPRDCCDIEANYKRWLGAVVVLVLALLATLAAPTLVFAEAGKNHSSTAGGGGGIGQVILIIWCVQSRHKPIGGWLLLFFIQLYLGIVVTAVLTVSSIANYYPSTWNGSPLYYLFLLSTVPGLLLRATQTVAGCFLLRTRAWKWVSRLRVLLVADLVCAIISLVIDLASFPDSIVFSVIALIWPLMWLPYFYVSKRVKRVFLTKDWPDAQKPVPNEIKLGYGD